MPAERYRKNAGAVFNLKYHFVWCPKYRKSVLGGPAKVRLEQLLREKAQELELTIHALEIEDGFVSLTIRADPTYAPAQLIAQLKGGTYAQLKAEFEELQKVPSFWSREYGVWTGQGFTEKAKKEFLKSQDELRNKRRRTSV